MARPTRPEPTRRLICSSTSRSSTTGSPPLHAGLARRFGSSRTGSANMSISDPRRHERPVGRRNSMVPRRINFIAWGCNGWRRDDVYRRHQVKVMLALERRSLGDRLYGTAELDIQSSWIRRTLGDCSAPRVLPLNAPPHVSPQPVAVLSTSANMLAWPLPSGSKSSSSPAASCIQRKIRAETRSGRSGVPKAVDRGVVQIHLVEREYPLRHRRQAPGSFRRPPRADTGSCSAGALASNSNPSHRKVACPEPPTQRQEAVFFPNRSEGGGGLPIRHRR